MMPNFWSLVVMEIFIMITYCATSDEEVGIIMIVSSRF